MSNTKQLAYIPNKTQLKTIICCRSYSLLAIGVSRELVLHQHYFIFIVYMPAHSMMVYTFAGKYYTMDKLQTQSGLQAAKDLGLLESEYKHICEILGRIPNFTELSIYSVMWSEHCSYKNSITWLKTLPKKGPHMLVEAGEENAGLVDIGDGLGCAFKIESHNHPSALEPYQGAATGVGGINRDIFTMGARPIAQLNSLRFGNIDKAHTKWLVKGVVKGIGDYGNAFGVPVLGGEVYFDDCYQTNPLVNAMSVGIVDVDKVISATAEGIGNPVFIVGSSTGKDGIHGAAFASKDITEDSKHDLPSVQVGDPFQEKLLLEASLELADTDVVVGMQDMGAAGITCSTSEMSAKGGVGMIINLDKVPTRQKGMKPYEILLSESQERMLVVIHKGKEQTAMDIFEKWDLNCVQIGEVCAGGQLKYYMGGKLVADVPAESLVLGGGAPVYQREFKEPSYFKENLAFNIDTIPQPESFSVVAKYLLGHPNLASKEWIIEQYDSMVGVGNATTNFPSDAGIVILKGKNKGIAMTVDCNALYVHNNPNKGAQIAVAEAARNIVCSGGIPSAVTNCLNFGNPYNPEVYWQFKEAITGMGQACKAFNTPVTGGNVSFYNQSVLDSGEESVYPTPTIGMIGLVNNLHHMTSIVIKEGFGLYLLGESKNDISSSEYLHSFIGERKSDAPYFDLDEEKHLHKSLIQLIENKAIDACHDVSNGGLFLCLAEMSMAGNIGFNLTSEENFRKDAFWFGEAQGRVVVGVKPEKEEQFLSMLSKLKLPHYFLGNAEGNSLTVDGERWLTLDSAADLYSNAIRSKMEQ